MGSGAPKEKNVAKWEGGDKAQQAEQQQLAPLDARLRPSPAPAAYHSFPTDHCLSFGGRAGGRARARRRRRRVPWSRAAGRLRAPSWRAPSWRAPSCPRRARERGARWGPAARRRRRAAWRDGAGGAAARRTDSRGFCDHLLVGSYFSATLRPRLGPAGNEPAGGPGRSRGQSVSIASRAAAWVGEGGGGQGKGQFGGFSAADWIRQSSRPKVPADRIVGK